jgi:hypothetical protein
VMTMNQKSIYIRHATCEGVSHKSFPIVVVGRRCRMSLTFVVAIVDVMQFSAFLKTRIKTIHFVSNNRSLGSAGGMVAVNDVSF